MDNVQYNLCCEVLRRLHREKVLDHMVLIGSWCLLAYEDYFKNVQYRPGIRTRDIDFLIPLPSRFDHKVDLEELFRDLDFVTSFKGRKGFMQFVHNDLMLEFIVPERGRGSSNPITIADLGINAQPLRFMDFLASNIIRLKFAGLKVATPHPVNFALIKVLVSSRRQKSVKSENDLRQAVDVLRALIEAGETASIKQTFSSCPTSWKKSIRKTLQNEPLAEEISKLLLE